VAIAVFLAFVVTLVSPAAATPSPSLVGVPLGIHAVNSGLCVDVIGGPSNQTNGSLVQQYTCQPRTSYNQFFKLVQLGSSTSYSVVVQSTAGSATPSCLDAPANQGANGTRIQMYTCSFSSGAPQQLWTVDPSGSGWSFRNVAFGRCLDIQGGSTSTGAALQLYDCLGTTNQQFTLPQQSYPRVGILYQSWFNDQPADPNPCNGSGWAGTTNGAGSKLGPFQVDYNAANHFVVQSMTLAGPCYSSTDPNAATQHAILLAQMGVSFALLDDTNLGKTKAPADNLIYNASKSVTQGLNQATPAVKAAYMLSLSCWQVQCYSSQGSGQYENAIWNAGAIGAEAGDIASRYTASPGQFETVNGKPLLVLYVNTGSGVYCPTTPPADLQATGLCPNASYPIMTHAFNGPGQIVPSAAEFHPTITVNGVQKNLTDVFSVRFGVVATSGFDYSSYSSTIWPMYCGGMCVGAEAGYASDVRSGAARSTGSLSQYLGEALTANGSSNSYLLLNGWNEFSSTDEWSNHSWTLEPNTYLHTVPGDEANGDPWYFFNFAKASLNKWR